METTTLTCEPRTNTGSKASRALRAKGKLPVVVYGHGETPESLTVERHDVEVALLHGARIVSMEVAGKMQSFLIKEVQYDHLDHLLFHVDFARVNLNERVQVRVGIELRGTPKGLADGGILDQIMSEIEVDCLVTEIPNVLHPVVTELGIGDALLVRDLPIPEGVKALADEDEMVANVKLLAIADHEEEEEEPGEGSEGEDAQPELVGRSKKDEESDRDKAS